MPADAIYYDSEFNRYIKPRNFNARFARSYGEESTMQAILSEMYSDMASVESFNTLHLLFHGASLRDYNDVHQMSHVIEGTSIHMGSGRLNAANLELLRPFHGRIRQIYLYSCSIASTYGSMYRPFGEPSGFDFCSRIAQVTGAHVYASGNVQFVNLVMLHQFNGRVYLFNPDGTYIMQQDLPAAR